MFGLMSLIGRGSSLPSEVAEELKASFVSIRDKNDDSGDAYAIVGFSRYRVMWTWSEDNARKRISNAYPELNDKQIDKAVTLVSALVSKAFGEDMKRIRDKKERINFVNRYKHESGFDRLGVMNE